MQPPNLWEIAYEDMDEILDDALQDWYHKRKDYRDAFLDLGSKGQFSDMWRKMRKLKIAVWEDEPLQGEQPEQIAREIIPHCLMMIYCLRREKSV
jgi:hypothetical protein